MILHASQLVTDPVAGLTNITPDLLEMLDGSYSVLLQPVSTREVLHTMFAVVDRTVSC